jgi:hypothetical protein
MYLKIHNMFPFIMFLFKSWSSLYMRLCVCDAFSFEDLLIQFAYYLENEPKQITYGSTFLGLVIIIMPNFLQITFPKH